MAGSGLNTPASGPQARFAPIVGSGRNSPDESMFATRTASPDVDERSLLLPRGAHLKERKWKRFSRKSAYYIPVLDWLPSYSASQLLGDVVAGVTLACLLVPQSISYASQLAHLQPVHGLFAAGITSLLYPLLCTGRQVSIGPEASLSLLVGQLIDTVMAHEKEHGRVHDPASAAQLATAVTTLVTFEVGAITFIFGLLRLGFLDAVLSRPLLRGFVSAVGLVILVEQVFPVLGLSEAQASLDLETENAVTKAVWVIRNLSSTHALTAAVSVCSLFALLGARFGKPHLPESLRALRFVPEILVVTVVSTALAKTFAWDKKGLQVLGSVRASNTQFRPPFHTLRPVWVSETLGTAFTICVVGYVDSITAAKAEASRFHYSISPNRELVAIGAANLACSFVAGTIPGFGSITRARLNSNSGARTQLASIVSGVVILLATFFLLPFLYHLPKCVLATIVLVVVYSILSETPHDVAFFVHVRGWQELGLMLMTFLLSTLWDVKTGILVSIGASLVLVVKDAAAVQVRILGRVPGTERWEPIDPELDGEEEIPGVLVVRIRDSLNFANAGGLKERLRRLEMYGPERHHPSAIRRRADARVLVFNFDTETLDPSALQIFAEIVEQYDRQGVVVFLCHVKPSQKEAMDRAGIVRSVGEDHFLATVNDVLRHLQESTITVDSTATITAARARA